MSNSVFADQGALHQDTLPGAAVSYIIFTGPANATIVKYNM
jgi:hypothetical protein